MTDDKQQPEPLWLESQPNLLNPNWKYIPAAQTNILQRFKDMGWVPPSEAKREKNS
jgi:hypothetical protein